MNEYDYVIVGAGSAGCVLAARLSEDPSVRVALVEAGGPDNAQEILIPAAFPSLFKGALDWDFDTEPEPGLGGRRAYLPRGKVLGGSSSINAMIYIRGNRADYDDWAADGALGWSYDDVLPYFRKGEDNERGADEFHGMGGPLPVRESRSRHPLAAAFLTAAEEAGYRRNDDFNGKEQEGVGFYQLTQRDGLRVSASASYLQPIQALRTNLEVITGQLVNRVVFEGDRATGVEILRGSEVEVMRATREVIVSAGAYGSPKLLLLSGIGSPKLLQPFGIDVRWDLPVGAGLQDHLMAPLNFRTDIESLMTAATPENAQLLMGEGRGPLSSNIGEAGGFFRGRGGVDLPDVQFHMAPVLFHQEGLGIPTEHAFALGPCVLKPTSRGQVSLRCADPNSDPRISHRYLDTQQDRDSIVSGVRIAMDIARQPALQSITTGDFDVPVSDSTDDILDFVRRSGMTLFHPTSSCAIGAVVDSKLRVLGVEGLRVVDASVMPSITRGNTNAPTIMIAERAADLIKGVAA